MKSQLLEHISSHVLKVFDRIYYLISWTLDPELVSTPFFLFELYEFPSYGRICSWYVFEDFYLYFILIKKIHNNSTLCYNCVQFKGLYQHCSNEADVIKLSKTKKIFLTKMWNIYYKKRAKFNLLSRLTWNINHLIVFEISKASKTILY